MRQAWNAEYLKELETLKIKYLANAQEYYSQFNYLVENGQRISLDVGGYARLMEQTETLLNSLVNHYSHWELPFDADSVKVHIEQHNINNARKQQDSECLSAHLRSDENSGPMRTENLRERVMYLIQEQSRLQDNKNALVQYYQQSLSGICQRFDQDALNTWLSQFDANIHSVLLNQPLPMTNGQLPLTLCVDAAKPESKMHDAKTS